ncbi:MAG: response regulator transcription factor [Cyclobacteriaceae bacterium]|nr:response regulator transcription factor [Cyclobacteriaceae bacterium HetDA_MAG_MS6]
MNSTSLLLVEDDEHLGFVITDNLKQRDFDVLWVRDGAEGLKAFEVGGFDLCILDIMMPRMDGFSLAKAIREQDEFVPIIFLTAKSLEEDKLKGFEIGGDDYLTKPFSVKELEYRIRVFLRRNIASSEDVSEKRLNVGAFAYDKHNLLLKNGEACYTLTQMEGDLLQLLLSYRNTLVKREEILVKIWGENDYFKGRSLDVFISRLRKYLKADPTIEIRNHHGVGFTLIC